MLSFTRAPWWPADTLPSTQSAASSSVRASATCSGERTLGMARSMGGSEREVGAQEIGAGRTRTEAGAVVIKGLHEFLVEQIVHVEAQGEVLADRVAPHEVEQPVGGHFARDLGGVVVAAGHFAGILEAAAEHHLIGEPVAGEEIAGPLGDERERGA